MAHSIVRPSMYCVGITVARRPVGRKAFFPFAPLPFGYQRARVWPAPGHVVDVVVTNEIAQTSPPRAVQTIMAAPRPATQAAARAALGELHRSRCGHGDGYAGGPDHTNVLHVELDFLRRHARISATVDR